MHRWADRLEALTGKADGDQVVNECAAISTGHCFGRYGPNGKVQCRYCGEPKATQPAATGAGEAIRLIQMVIPWVSEGSQADLRKVIALVSAMDPAKAPDPIEAAEGFLEIALTAFTERQSIDPSTGYGEYNDRDEEYHADLVSALDAVKGLHDVPPDRSGDAP